MADGHNQKRLRPSDRDPVVLALLALLEKDIAEQPHKLIPLDGELAELMMELEFAALDLAHTSISSAKRATLSNSNGPATDPQTNSSV